MNAADSARPQRRIWLIAILALLTWLTPAFGDVSDSSLTLGVDDVAFEFVRIPAGRFVMGSDSGDSDERPVHKVTIPRPFHLMRTEVTVRQFKAFVKDTGYKTDAERSNWAWLCPVAGLAGPDRNLNWRIPGFRPSDDDPVVVLSWDDATAFCRWLSEKTSRPVRLPTEAEWEYAARAERAQDVNAIAWYDSNAGAQTHPVGQKTPNAWGLYDTQGNAWEWCLDVWHPTYEGAPTDGTARASDPRIPKVAHRYVLRGGCWASPAAQCRPAYRYRGTSNFRNCGTGFRVVVDPPLRTSALHAVSAKTPTVACPRPAPVTLDELGFEFVRIHAGTFMLGSLADDEEKPVRKVTIDYDFEIGRTEVTRKQFRAFLEATGYITEAQKEGWAWTRSRWKDWHPELDISWRNPGYPQEDNHPAACISWYDAKAFCRWLSQASGETIRLPSSTEWEYACRAGTTGDYAGDIEEMGWHRYNSGQRTHPVAQRKPSPWGLYDMHGNVWEWCLDMWHFGHAGAPVDGSAWTTADIFIPLMRGGSFTNPQWWLRSARNMRNDPGCRHSYNHGFRIVRELPARGSSSSQSAKAGFVPVETQLPRQQFEGTPKDIRAPRIKPVQTKAYPPFLAPAGTTNVALGKPVSSSDPEPVIGDLAMVTDGNKEAGDGSFVELGPLLQHVTIDLQSEHQIHGIRLWHYHLEPRVYFDVIVQVADDPNFAAGVKTVFNNDMDDSTGLGLGKDMHYVDTHYGELLDAKGICGRYVRLYSNGSTADDLNHYIEVEIYGRPVKEIDNLASHIQVTQGSRAD